MKKKPNKKPIGMIRNRIKEFRMVVAKELFANPKNWREHPEKQQEALRGILEEVGYADALLARILPDGQLELIDGHLRANTTPEQEVPVLILDVNEDEASLLLATLDPLAAMAEANKDALGQLLMHAQTENEALEAMLQGLAKEKGIDLFQEGGQGGGGDDSDPAEAETVSDTWSLVVVCTDAADQKRLFDQLTAEGRSCRPLTI